MRNKRIFFILALFVLYSVLALIGIESHYRKPEKLERVITVVPGGRLGNHIWEFMSLIAVAKLYNSSAVNLNLKLDVHMKQKLNKVFKGIDSIPATKELFENRREYLENENIPNIVAIDHGPIVLAPFVCRIHDIKSYGFENVKKYLQFQDKYVETATMILNRIKLNFGNFDNATYVGMHYRGGDYVISLEAKFKIKVPPTFKYYQKAMKYFIEIFDQIIFILITTDLKWLEQNKKHLQKYNVVTNLNVGVTDSYVDDLVLLSICNHSIISYGTYGATAGILTRGVTFAYDAGIPPSKLGYSLVQDLAKIWPGWFLCNETDCARPSKLYYPL